jgi:hypothetical protein
MVLVVDWIRVLTIMSYTGRWGRTRDLVRFLFSALDALAPQVLVSIEESHSPVLLSKLLAATLRSIVCPP